jgi:hypothetical protein
MEFVKCRCFTFSWSMYIVNSTWLVFRHFLDTIKIIQKKKKKYKIRNKTKRDNGLLLINPISTTRRSLFFYSTILDGLSVYTYIHDPSYYRYTADGHETRLRSPAIVLYYYYSRGILYIYIYIHISIYVYRYYEFACKDDMPGILNDNLLLSVSGYSVCVCVCAYI